MVPTDLVVHGTCYADGGHRRGSADQDICSKDMCSKSGRILLVSSQDGSRGQGRKVCICDGICVDRGAGSETAISARNSYQAYAATAHNQLCPIHYAECSQQQRARLAMAQLDNRRPHTRIHYTHTFRQHLYSDCFRLFNEAHKVGREKRYWISTGEKATLSMQEQRIHLALTVRRL